MSGATRPDIPAVPTIAAEPSGAESPALPPVGRSATATGPADRVQEDAAKARTLLSGVLLDELVRRVLDYENAITWDTSCTSCARVLDSAAAERERAERAEARLDEVRRAIAAFLGRHGNSAAFALQSARDLAEGIRQVLDRAALDAPETGKEPRP